MIKIALTIVHNKTDAQNEAQIVALAALLTTIEDVRQELDQNGQPTGATYSTFHQEFKNLPLAHEVRVYQVVPFGVTPPPSLYAINSGGVVHYGQGDEDKTGEHPRFFNWALKRGTDQGADLAVYLRDPAALTATNLRQAVQALKNDVEFVEGTFGKLATARCLKQIGQFKEDRDFASALTDYKSRISQGGLKTG